DPGDISSKDLVYGQGGEDGQPKPPFTFLGEKKHDSNPKFDVRDANGHSWRVKLGAEARPEIVASRLLWAVGYFTENDYVLARATVPGLHLHHTAHSVENGDQVVNARFARKPDGEKLFLVSDTGASFGTNSTRMKNENGKGNVRKYAESRFITHQTDTEVSFGTPAPPTVLLMESAGLLAPLYFKRLGYDWIGDDIPRADARWIG